MTDIQILTVAIAITFPVLGFVGTIAALMHSNKRVDDMKADSNKRLDDMRSDLSKRFDEMTKHIDSKIDTGFEHMELLLRLHEAEHHKN